MKQWAFEKRNSMNKLLWAWDKWKRYVESGVAVWIAVNAARLLFWLNRLFA